MKRSSRLRIRLIVIAVMCVSLSGCFIRQTLIEVFTNDVGTYIDLIFDGVNVAYCRDVFDFNTGYSNVECRYSIDNGSGFGETTSTAELLSKLGVFGLIVDPLILQVPEDVTVRAGTYSTQSGSGNLVSYVRYAVPVDTTKFMHAEPGHKLVILDLPPTVAGEIPSEDPQNGLSVDYRLSLERNRTAENALEPFDVKVLFTLPFDVGDVRYYLPMLPCQSDFSQLPAITIDPANPNSGLMSRIFEVFDQSAPCNNEFYDFISAGPQLVPDATRLDFGVVSLGESQTRVLTLRAAGVSDLSLGSTFLPSGADFSLVDDGCTNQTLTPGDTCDITVQFTPDGTSGSASSMRVTSNDLFLPFVDIALSGIGSDLAPAGTTSCDALDFKRIGQGQTSTSRLAVWNTGSVNLSVSSLSLSGSDGYTLVNDKCSATTVAPGFGCIVEVALTTTSTALSQGQLTVNSNATGVPDVLLSGSSELGLIHTGDFESRCDSNARQN